MENIGLKFTEEGMIEDFLGIQFEKGKAGVTHIKKPHLMQSILKELHLQYDNMTTKETQSATSQVLTSHERSEPLNKHFNYRKVVGMMNYLE